MSLQVESEVIRSGERSLAVGALERFHSSMLAHVSGEFVRPCEFPCAALPCALVRFLSSVGPLMGLEVRALCVDLVAAGVGAAVHSLVSLWLGIVVDGIDKIIWVVGSHSRGQEMGDGQLLLHRR